MISEKSVKFQDKNLIFGRIYKNSTKLDLHYPWLGGLNHTWWRMCMGLGRSAEEEGVPV